MIVAALPPAGLTGRLSPAPHAGVKAAEAGLLRLLLLHEVRWRTAEVRGRVALRFTHFSRSVAFYLTAVGNVWQNSTKTSHPRSPLERTCLFWSTSLPCQQERPMLRSKRSEIETLVLAKQLMDTDKNSFI